MELNEIMTIPEAAKIWHKEVSTIRYACIRKKFSDSEAKKSGGTWLVTTEGMNRVFGKPKATPK